MAPSPPPTSTASAPPPATPEQLRALYDQAVATGDAAELVRELCRTLGVNLRGLAELTGVARNTVWTWSAGRQKPSPLALHGLEALVSPTKALQRRIEKVRSLHPLGSTGRPKKRIIT